MPNGIKTLAELKEDIKEIFNFGPNDYTWIEDYAAIAEYFQNPRRFIEPLWELDRDMLSRLEDNPIVNTGNRTVASLNRIDVAKPVIDGKPDVMAGHGGVRMKWYKCLSDALLRMEVANGFNATLSVKNAPTVKQERPFSEDGPLKSKAVVGDLKKTRPTETSVPVLTGVIKAGHFNAVLLANGLHWKDPSVSPDHGEYTHRIQWWCVVKGNIRLHNSPADLFKKLAQPSCFFVKGEGDSDTRSMFYWLCDAWDGTRDANGPLSTERKRPWKAVADNFRSPEFFNRWMISNPLAKEFPLLSQYLADRYHKRANAKFGEKTGFAAVNAKLFDKHGSGVKGSMIAWNK